MQYRKSVTLAFALASCCFAARGQDPYYTVINKTAGLPSSAIYGLFQDSRGFIWISGNEGLTRYDGFEFKTYYNPKQTSTAGDKIAEDKYGRIWYKNFDGYLYYVKDDSLHALKQNATNGNSIYAIIDDRLLVLQKQGIDIFDLTSLRIIKTIPFDHLETVSQVQYRDHFYLAAQHRLYKISPTGSVDTLPVSGISEMMAGKNSIMVINKNNASGFWEEIRGSALVHKICTSRVANIHSGAYCGGLYWLFTPNGAWIFNEDGTDFSNRLPLFPALNVSAVLKDRDNNYWFGTLNDGVLFVPDMNTSMVVQTGFVPTKLKTVDSTLYVGTENNEVFSYSLATGKLEKKFSGVRHEVISLASDTVNRKFYLASSSFFVMDAQFKVLANSARAVKDVALIDRKYISTASSGAIELVKVGEGTSAWDSFFNASNMLYQANRRAIDPDMALLMDAGRGRTVAYSPITATVYAGSNKGLHAISLHGIREIKLNGESIYPHKLVYHGGKVYVLTPHNNLYVVGADNVIRQIPLQNEQLHNIKSTGGNLYLVTEGGIKMLDTNSGKYALMEVHPGLRNEEINDISQIGSSLVVSSGRGLIVVNKITPAEKKMEPGFAINEISVDDKKIGTTIPGVLTHQQNDIEIRYSILSFNTDAQYGLFYKINGGLYKKASNATRTLRLASLAPGEYNISFVLRNEHGSEFPVHNLRFTIKKPFWAEWWFWGLCAALFSAGAYSYYKWQTIQLKKQNALRLEKVELEKNLRNSMLTSIRAQMNPHFFYNALNTIQSFIFSDDKRNASTYLVKLSKLTRMVLEMTEKDTISLEEETDALKLYLELEKIRFSEDFNYELSISNNVDLDIVRIPPMIVQPYVENAIKHGLLHKKGDKKLSVQFEKQDKTLCITIDDNGIGRAKAGEIGNIKKGKHHSFATSANLKRIELLNKERNKDIGVVYIDKTNEGGSPYGTTVIISIPLN